MNRKFKRTTFYFKYTSLLSVLIILIYASLIQLLINLNIIVLLNERLLCQNIWLFLNGCE